MVFAKGQGYHNSTLMQRMSLSWSKPFYDFILKEKEVSYSQVN
jgi:hypothetical protein